MSRRRFAVGRVSARRRLDRFLVAACGDLSRARIQKLIGSGAVTVDGAPERRPSRSTEEGQTIEVELPDVPVRRQLLAQEIPLEILFEDADVLAVNKPPGLVVHPAPGHDSGTLVNAILHHCRGRLPGIAGELRPGIVHRLDRDTSGVLLVAKTDRAHAGLSRQMKKREIRKEYAALAAGRPKVRKGEIALPIGRDPRDRKRMKAFREARPPSVREARTFFEIEREWPDLNLSLLRVRLGTGRTHQIRVHLAAIGCPVVGDPAYGRPRYAKIRDPALRKMLEEFPRQALHADSITFRHPATDEEIRIAAPWPADLIEIVDRLGERRG
jgi:23S rRNA pseudouridine1911/1915/1917 synthase